MNFRLKRPQLSVILPTYNESGNIVRLIKSIQKIAKQLRISAEILIVDDDSSDGTAEIIYDTFSRNKSVTLFVRKKERGLASAIRFGIKRARGTYIVVMDTDFNHDPKVILSLFRLKDEFDLIIGSRYVNGGGMENRTRYYLSYIFNVYLRILLGHGIRDNLSGYFLIQRKNLRRVGLDRIFEGFGEYFMKLIYELYVQGYKIAEVPVFYKNRTYGVSKSRFVNMLITYTSTAIKLRMKNV